MSELTCTCPHCSQDLSIGSEYAGQAVGCPSCSGEFTVPDAPAASQAPVLAAPPQLNIPASPVLQRPPAQPQTQARPPQYQQPPPHNPYQAPQSNPAGPQYGHPGIGGPSPRAIQLFVQTKPWVTLFAVLGSIAPLLLLLFGAFVAFVGSAAGEVAGAMSTGLVFIAIGGIYFLPAWRLWQYSGAIGKLRFSPTLQALDDAIDRQRCFWKTVGIITVCAIALYLCLGAILALTVSTVASDPELFLTP